DNPKRPRLHFWFGPISLIDFLGCYNLWSESDLGWAGKFAWWPGTCHESPMYECKLGIRAALQDIQNNHPNDWVTMIKFSHPQGTATPSWQQYYADGGRFNRVSAPLGRNYTRMIDSLFFAPYTIDNPSTEVRPYDKDSSGVPYVREVPNAVGGTCYSMGL